LTASFSNFGHAHRKLRCKPRTVDALSHGYCLTDYYQSINQSCPTDVDAVERVADVRCFPHVEKFGVDLETAYAAAESDADSRHVTDERQIAVAAEKHRRSSSQYALYSDIATTD